MPRAGPERRAQKKPVDGGANAARSLYELGAVKAAKRIHSQAENRRKPSNSAAFLRGATFL
jgi:hypothetical protein